MHESASLGERGGRKSTPREVVDQKLRRIGRDRAKLEYETCALLLEGERVGVRRSYGYASIREYAEAIVGLSPRETEERLRVARALETLPEVAERFRSAKLLFTSVRELTRVATAQTEHEWLEAAGSKTTRQIERIVAGHAPGDRPSDPVNEEARRHRVVLDLSAQAFALLRDAKTELVKSTGHSLDDDAFITLLARSLLLAEPPRGGETEPPQGGATEPPQGGKAEPAVAANYRIGLVTCPGCKKTVRTGGSEDVVVEPHVLGAAMCHAEVVDVDNDVRATQTIPPWIQRQVRLRHHDRCAVPGCRNAVTDLHHLDERAEGGTHDPNRMLPLCGAHHDAAHRHVLVVGGDAMSGFTFAHADGRPYGSAEIIPRQAQALANVEGMLRSLGYKGREARAMVDAIRGRFSPDVPEEELLRAALCEGPTLSGVSRVSDAIPAYSARSVHRGAAPLSSPRGKKEARSLARNGDDRPRRL